MMMDEMKKSVEVVMDMRIYYSMIFIVIWLWLQRRYDFEELQELLD